MGSFVLSGRNFARATVPVRQPCFLWLGVPICRGIQIISPAGAVREGRTMIENGFQISDGAVSPHLVLWLLNPRFYPDIVGLQSAAGSKGI